MVTIGVIRKDKIEEYTCVNYKVKDGSYLYLYNSNCTVSPVSLLGIVPIHDKDIVSINFRYGE